MNEYDEKILKRNKKSSRKLKKQMILTERK